MEKAMPGSPFNDEKMSHAQVAALYRKYGLDGPIWLQFFNYLKNHGCYWSVYLDCV